MVNDQGIRPALEHPTLQTRSLLSLPSNEPRLAPSQYQWHRFAMRWLLLVTACFALNGCSMFKKKEAAQNSGRGAIRTRQDEIENPDINTMMQKEFYMGGNSQINGRGVSTKPAQSRSFLFVDRTRTKEFGTRDFTTKSARTEEYPDKEKSAPTKDAPEQKRSFLSKIFTTRKAREADKVAATDALTTSHLKPKKKRSSPVFDLSKEEMPYKNIPQDNYNSDLTELKTVEDIRALLNKN